MTPIWAGLGLLAAFIAGVGGNLLGDEVKGWVGRIPYAILWAAARRVPPIHRAALHAEWMADLAHELQDRNERPITRLLVGVRFAAGLVRGGRQVALELGSLRTTPEVSADLSAATAAVWLSGPPRRSDEFLAFFRQAYGVNLKPTGRSEYGEMIYRGPGGDLIKCRSNGACGSSYWQVFRLTPNQNEPLELIRCCTTNETGQVQEVLIRPYS